MSLLASFVLILLVAPQFFAVVVVSIVYVLLTTDGKRPKCAAPTDTICVYVFFTPYCFNMCVCVCMLCCHLWYLRGFSWACSKWLFNVISCLPFPLSSRCSCSILPTICKLLFRSVNSQADRAFKHHQCVEHCWPGKNRELKMCLCMCDNSVYFVMHKLWLLDFVHVHLS